jgi:hypothetical protein
MPDQVLLIFDQPHGPYNQGDVAGFSPEAAERILGLRRLSPADGMAPVAHRASEAEVQPRPPRPVPAKRRVRFRHPVGPYRVGDIAAFPPEIAEKYVAGYRHGAGSQPPVADYVTEEEQRDAEPPAPAQPAAVPAAEAADATRRRGRFGR